MNYGQKSREADEVLRQWLEASGLPIGGRLPSERQLARELGIHPSVMNRAMGRVLAEGWVERRGYKLFRAAQISGGSLDSPCDLVILNRSKRLDGFRKVSRELRFPLREHLAASAEDLVRILEGMDSPATESVILVPPYGDETEAWGNAAKKLLKRGIPVICVGRRLSGLASVASDRGLEKILAHLAACGHTEMALLVASPWTHSVGVVTARWGELCRRFALESSRERVRHQNSSHMLNEDLLALAEKLNSEWKKVTALVISTDDDLPIQRLLDVFRRHKISVPKRLSLISLFDHPPLQTASPPVGAALEDLALEHETAFLLARRALRKRERLGLLSLPTEIDVALDIHERSSVIAIPQEADPVDRRKAAAGSLPVPLPLSGWNLGQADPDVAGGNPYPLVADEAGSRFRSLDLAGRVNRPLHFRRGWLGDLPLSSLAPGRQVFHGVPFQILGGATRKDGGAIVFQSLRNSTGSTARLPSKLRLPVQARARAVYILHGCGYVQHRARFGSYSFFQGEKKLAQVPLVALGRPKPGAETWELAEAVLESNIQDWWPDYPHCNFRQARMVPLPDSKTAGPFRGYVFLYTLEWINPAPDLPLSHIEIEADPNLSTTLGVLAISLLKPEGGAGLRAPGGGRRGR